VNWASVTNASQLNIANPQNEVFLPLPQANPSSALRVD